MGERGEREGRESEERGEREREERERERWREDLQHCALCLPWIHHGVEEVVH